MDRQARQHKPAARAEPAASGARVAGPRHAALSRLSATLNGAPVQLNKSQRKRAARRRAAREYQEAQERQRREKEERQRAAEALRTKPEFRAATPAQRDKMLRRRYRLEPGLSPDQEVARRRELAAEFGFSKSPDNLPGSRLKMDGWHSEQADIIGGHHKLPKRVLGFLYEKMTPDQRTAMRARLHLDPDAGHKALARLRSNIIPRGPKQVEPDSRIDDPDHAGIGGDGEGVDTVADSSGTMTPRSRTYVSLAAHAQAIHERLAALPGATMSDEEATVATDHLHKAEVLHHTMEGRLDAADYGPKFWRTKNRAKGQRRFLKGRAEPKAPQIGPPQIAAFDAAHVARQEAQREEARQAAQREREAAQREAEAAERARREEQARERDRAVPRDNIFGKSSRFW